MFSFFRSMYCNNTSYKCEKKNNKLISIMKKIIQLLLDRQKDMFNYEYTRLMLGKEEISND